MNEFADDTWLERECEGTRRCRAKCPDGKLRVFRVAGVCDTFFSISVRGGGWIGSDGGVLVYHPPIRES